MDDRDLDALPRAARIRLERFAAEFERLSAADYSLFATGGDDEAEDGPLAAAKAAAEQALGTSGRAAAAGAAREFAEWVSLAYSRRIALPDTILMYQALPDRPDDRIRVRRAVEAAVIGLVCWDALAPDELATLLGPFGEMAERAAGEPLERPG